MAEFDSSIISRELPVDRRFVLISGTFPRGDLRTECRCVRNASIKAFCPQCTELDLCHVQPTPMFWREVEFELAEQPPSLLWRKMFVEGVPLVRVQIIHYYPDAVGIRVVIIYDRLHLLDEFLLPTPLRYFDVPPASQRFTHHEEVACSIPFVRVVVPSDRSRT